MRHWNHDSRIHSYKLCSALWSTRKKKRETYLNLLLSSTVRQEISGGTAFALQKAGPSRDSDDHVENGGNQ